MIDVSISIVSWNVRDQLRTCLQSIQQYTTGLTYEIIVVDNASADGSADMVAKDFPDIRLIRNATNRGFGVANNQAVAIAQGQDILFLNDDCQFTTNILPSLQTILRNTPNVGMVGIKLLNTDGSTQPQIRAWPKVSDQTVIQLKLHHVFPKLVQRYHLTDFDYTVSAAVPQVMGAFMYMSLAIAKQYGPFDEAYFAWFEEVDLQKRLQADGLTVWYEASVSCQHARGQSFKQLRRPAAQRIFNRSLRTYMKKHHGWLAYLWFLGLHPISLLLAYVAQVVQ
ncbi:MAG: hypothetical protein ACD_41C00337G0014 [uncultured bacterium]|nr:MAG: hypothetical protein ACD_41C00337G0014 [uncultured bacterium]HBY73320.1 hypothetical protein [Candidatus Kerfeldbacteria bacterium]